MARRLPQRGVTLISVLTAMLIFSLGMLGMVGVYARFVSAVSDNQVLTQLAPVSHSFWAQLQANRANVGNYVGTYTSATLATAHADIRPLLTTILSPAAGSSMPPLPNAQVVIAVGADANANASCADPTGVCQTVSLVISWSANGQNSVTRSQTFNYQLGF